MAKVDVIPEFCSLNREYEAASHRDCFSAYLTPDNDKSPAALLQQMFYPLPIWMRVLMRIRNWIVPIFGVSAGSNTASRSPLDDEDVAVGGKIGFFDVVGLTDQEIVVTANDRHLDASFSLFVKTGEAQKTVYLTTAVKAKERFGNIYMFVINPFHRLIVCHLLDRLSKG